MTDHLTALTIRLAHEQEYLAKAKKSGEIALRQVWVNQITKEIEDEKAFLASKGYTFYDALESDMSDDELLAELFS